MSQLPNDAQIHSGPLAPWDRASPWYATHTSANQIVRDSLGVAVVELGVGDRVAGSSSAAKIMYFHLPSPSDNSPRGATTEQAKSEKM